MKTFYYFQLQLNNLVYLCFSIQFIHKHLPDQIDLQKHSHPKLQPVEVFSSMQQINYFVILDFQHAKYFFWYLKSYWLSDFKEQIYDCYHDKHCWLSYFLGNYELFLEYSLISDLFCYEMKLLEFCNYIPNKKYI